ncbi:SUKH-4 family immunity protein [Cryptosporangium minutisporangium]
MCDGSASPSCESRSTISRMVANDPPHPPQFGEFEAWAGAGRVVRATKAELATWRLPEPQKAALISSGVPMFDELVHGVSFRAAPTMYRLAYFDDQDVHYRVTWDYGAVPETGEVREWPPSRPGRFVNSTVNHWLCSLQLVGSWFAHSRVINRWDEDAEAEDQALAEIDDLLDRIKAVDPAAIGDGSHETQFWPAVLGRWLY